jgi:Dyp-type peroxidase family
MSYPPPAPTPPPPPAQPPIRPMPAYPALAQDANIQGNVLAPFNKDFELFMFLQLPSQAQGQSFLTAMLPLISTNDEVAAFNMAFSAARRAGREDPDDLSATWVGLSLTGHGLGVLNPATSNVLEQAGWDPTVARLLAGASSAPDVATSGPEAPAAWFFGGPSQDIDAVVVLAADTADDLVGIVQEVRAVAAASGVLSVFEQAGRALPGARHGHEHFGFKDGISQPGVTGFDQPDTTTTTQVSGKPGTLLIEPGEFIFGYPGHDNSGRVVPSWMFDGSMLVVRRLHQDVPGWWAQAEGLSNALTMPSEQVGAKLVGRWRSGVPVVVEPSADPRSGPDLSTDNDFDYSNDLNGANAPLCAHIRKMNPRAGTVPGADAVGQRRILRRGIAFGEPFDPAAGKDHGPDAPRGLIFACYQTSIGEQFEFLQQSWANEADFPAAGSGPDPVIGPDGAGTIASGSGPQSVSFGRFVQVQGALYAFTPPIPTLQILASGGTLPTP